MHLTYRPLLDSELLLSAGRLNVQDFSKVNIGFSWNSPTSKTNVIGGDLIKYGRVRVLLDQMTKCL